MAFSSPREIDSVRRYRLLARPPYTVSFPSVVYEIHVAKVDGAPQWHLWATSLSGKPVWSITHGGEHAEMLERHLFTIGFEVVHPTAISLIMDRLVGAGRAERLPLTPPSASAGDARGAAPSPPRR